MSEQKNLNEGTPRLEPRENGRLIAQLAQTLRQVAITASERATHCSFPTTVFAQLPLYMTRVEKLLTGSITAPNRTHVEGGNLAGPVAKEMHRLVDGYVAHSRNLPGKEGFLSSIYSKATAV